MTLIRSRLVVSSPSSAATRPRYAWLDRLAAAFVQAATATRHYARDLVLETTLSRELDPPARAELIDAGRRLSDSVATLVGRLTEASADGGQRGRGQLRAGRAPVRPGGRRPARTRTDLATQLAARDCR